MKFLKLILFYTAISLPILGLGQQISKLPDSAALVTGDIINTCSGMCCCAGNSQAPLGIMTDHIHNKGQFMLTYTFMNTAYQGNRIGNAKASDNEVYQKYMMSPETMSMNMHMIMAMYGITDRFTVMAMGGFMTNSMSMNMSSAMMNMPGMVMPTGNLNMQTNAYGLTDTKISALYNFSSYSGHRIIGSLGLNLPTGSVTETGTTMLGDNQRLPYNMQPGTGSYAIDPGITYARKYVKYYWGADAGADLKLNFNSLGYKQGNVLHSSAWVGYQLLPYLSATFRAEDVMTGKLKGSDMQMNNQVYTATDPTTATANYGGNVVNTYIGLNFYIMKPGLSHFRLMAEYGIPVYQDPVSYTHLTLPTILRV